MPEKDISGGGRQNYRPIHDALDDEFDQQEVLPDGEVVPEGVVDKAAYERYMDAHAMLLNYPNNPYTNKRGVEINLLASKSVVVKKMVGCEQYEKDKVNRWLDEIGKLKGRVMAQKRKAYGIRGKYRGSTGGVILDVRFSELIELFGRFYTDQEVYQIVTKKWGYDINKSAITRFKQKYVEDIKRRQDIYTKDFSDIKLGHKRNRLEELTYLYRTRKKRYVDANYNREDGKEMRNLLEQIRKEMEGDRINLDGNIKLQIGVQIEMQIHEQLMQEVSIKQLIVSRVASRLNVNPVILLERMMTSFYAERTGFAKPDRDLDDIEPVYPSELLYDFETLKSRADSNRLLDGKNTVEKTIRTTIDDSREAEERRKTLKAMMMKRIIQKKMEMGQIEDRKSPNDPTRLSD